MKQKKQSSKSARITRKEAETIPELVLAETALLLPASVERVNDINRLPNGLLSNRPVQLLNKRTNMTVRVGYRTAFFLTKTEPKYYQILSS